MEHLEVDGLGQVSRVGLGTWQFGSKEWGYGDAYADGGARDIVHRALELGVTLFDTAEVYGFGRSEKILAQALGERRSEVVVASKIFPVAPVPRIVRHRADASAARLQLERIPLYQVHQPNPVVPDSVMRCRPVGVLLMEDDGGRDEKLLALPVSKLTAEYNDVKDVSDLPEILLKNVEHFFTHYKDLEPGKWAKIEKIAGVDEARKVIADAIELAKKD